MLEKSLWSFCKRHRPVLFGNLSLGFLCAHPSKHAHTSLALFFTRGIELVDGSAGTGDNPEGVRVRSARHGFEWWQFDITWQCVRLLQGLGLATNVKLPSEKQKQRMAIA